MPFARARRSARVADFAPLDSAAAWMADVAPCGAPLPRMSREKEKGSGASFAANQGDDHARPDNKGAKTLRRDGEFARGDHTFQIA